MDRKFVPVHRRYGDMFAFYTWMLTEIPTCLGIRCVEKTTRAAVRVTDIGYLQVGHCDKGLSRLNVNLRPTRLLLKV